MICSCPSMSDDPRDHDLGCKVWEVADPGELNRARFRHVMERLDEIATRLDGIAARLEARAGAPSSEANAGPGQEPDTRDV